MKEALAIIGALLIVAYFVAQALLTALQPLFAALTGQLH